MRKSSCEQCRTLHTRTGPSPPGGSRTSSRKPASSSPSTSPRGLRFSVHRVAFLDGRITIPPCLATPIRKGIACVPPSLAIQTSALSHRSSRRLIDSSHHGGSKHGRSFWYRRRYGDRAPGSRHGCQPGPAFNKPNATMPVLSSPFNHLGHHPERPGIRHLRKLGQPISDHS
jgi:hypothetical protein